MCKTFFKNTLDLNIYTALKQILKTLSYEYYTVHIVLLLKIINKFLLFFQCQINSNFFQSGNNTVKLLKWVFKVMHFTLNNFEKCLLS